MTTPSVLDVTHTGGYAATTSHSVAMPASVSSGQLLLMHIAVDGNKTFTTPSGWTIVVARAASAFNFQSTITYGKVSDGSEGGTNVTVTTSASGEGQAAVWRIGDWHGTLADDVTGLTGTYFNTTGPNPPSRSWGWGTDDVLSIAIAGGTSTHTVSSYPTNYADNQFDQDGGDTTIGITGATRSMTGASSPEDPGAFTFSGNATGVVTTIVVRGAAATAYTQTLTATVTPAGAAAKKVTSSKTGTVTPAGIIAQKVASAKAGTVTPAATIAQKVAKLLEAMVMPAGDLSTGGQRQTLDGSVTPTSTIANKVAQAVTATVTPAAALVNAVRKALSGDVAPDGTATNVRTQRQSLDGSVTPTAAIVNLVRQTLTATVTPIATVFKTVAKSLSGTVTPTATIAQKVAKSLSGSVTPAATLIFKRVQTLTGTVTPAGALSYIHIKASVIWAVALDAVAIFSSARDSGTINATALDAATIASEARDQEAIAATALDVEHVYGEARDG